MRSYIAIFSASQLPGVSGRPHSLPSTNTGQLCISLSFTLIIPLIGKPNARSPTQANLVQVCESTEITSDKNVVNFQVTISSVPTVYTRCAQGYHSSIFALALLCSGAGF